MTQHRIEDVQTQVYPLVYQTGTESGQCFYEDMRYTFRVAMPFLRSGPVFLKTSRSLSAVT